MRFPNTGNKTKRPAIPDGTAGLRSAGQLLVVSCCEDFTNSAHRPFSVQMGEQFD